VELFVGLVLGNVGLVRLWIYKENTQYFKEYSHYAYRMIQLGCFLLSVGIILGGIWADYSWGRFWGWDPKETWALIADLGFLAILHGRFAGWISPFSLLAWSPLAYLLVIMAWYGVNFILAAGLHSYGFSSGGATMVAIFVALQVALLIAGFFKFQTLKQPQHG
jgi:ABC-type transport system involved in cytochrome c biogenesis permease subunit